MTYWILLCCACGHLKHWRTRGYYLIQSSIHTTTPPEIYSYRLVDWYCRVRLPLSKPGRRWCPQQELLRYIAALIVPSAVDRSLHIRLASPIQSGRTRSPSKRYKSQAGHDRATPLAQPNVTSRASGHIWWTINPTSQRE